jgi:hypothetical protein
MGGRGAASGRVAVLPEAILAELPYNVTSFDDDRRGATFPFLEQTERAWRILTRPVDETADPHPAHTFGLDIPTLRWVNGNQVSDLYVDGLTTEQFLEATGLKLDMHKGGFVLSKRISRIMRPHFVSNFFDRSEKFTQIGTYLGKFFRTVLPGFWVGPTMTTPSGCIPLPTMTVSARCWLGAAPTRWASM